MSSENRSRLRVALISKDQYQSKKTYFILNCFIKIDTFIQKPNMNFILTHLSNLTRLRLAFFFNRLKKTKRGTMKSRSEHKVNFIPFNRFTDCPSVFAPRCLSVRLFSFPPNDNSEHHRFGTCSRSRRKIN